MGPLDGVVHGMTILGRTSWRALMARASRWLAGASYLQKWLILGVLIGTMAGVGAIVFYEALLACTHFFLGTLAGYHVPTPAGEGGHRASAPFTRPWALPLVVGLGALLGADPRVPVRPRGGGPRDRRRHLRRPPQPPGHPLPGRDGQDRRLRPHHRIGRIGRPRGSDRPDQRRLRLPAGPGAGPQPRRRPHRRGHRHRVGDRGHLRSTAGGAVLATEILYRDDFDAEALLPSFVASLVGYVIFGAADRASRPCSASPAATTSPIRPISSGSP